MRIDIPEDTVDSDLVDAVIRATVTAFSDADPGVKIDVTQVGHTEIDIRVYDGSEGPPYHERVSLQ